VADGIAPGITSAREVDTIGASGADAIGAGGANATGAGATGDAGAGWERRWPFIGCAHSGGAGC
jgi:hypothetical protein